MGTGCESSRSEVAVDAGSRDRAQGGGEGELEQLKKYHVYILDAPGMQGLRRRTKSREPAGMPASLLPLV